jgi:hypothetical protein
MNNSEEVNITFKKINNLDLILNNLSEHFSVINGRDISRIDIFDALYLCLENQLNWENQLDFWDLEITYQEAKKLLMTFDFRTIYNKIESGRDILVEGLLFSTKTKIKSKGLIWLIHMNDLDPFPSNPHAHELQSGLKLDLSNGNCYRKTKLVDKIKKKDLILIRDLASENFTLPQLNI